MALNPLPDPWPPQPPFLSVPQPPRPALDLELELIVFEMLMLSFVVQFDLHVFQNRLPVEGFVTIAR